MAYIPKCLLKYSPLLRSIKYVSRETYYDYIDVKHETY